METITMESHNDAAEDDGADISSHFVPQTPMKKQTTDPNNNSNKQGTPSSVLGDLRQEYLKHIIFDSWEDADAWYHDYAKQNGFGVRKRDFRKLNDGTLVSYKWVCSKEGQRDPKWNDKKDRKRKARAETREGCEARFRVKLDRNKEKWVITDFHDEHNHPIVKPNHVKFIRCHRKISEGDKALAEAMRAVGISTSKIMQFLAKEKGGYRNISYLPRDLHNHLYQVRQHAIADGDAATMLGYLNSRKAKEDGFYFIHTEKDDHTLGSVFWADTTSRADYLHFGDVLAFDSCYRRNLYNTPLVILVGVNHHHQSIIFGGAILENEETATYVWMLTQFLHCMGKKAPNAVVTDGDWAMKNAIEQVFPDAIHRRCAWHVQRNVPPALRCNDFTKRFDSCLLDRFEEEMFEKKWRDLLDDYNLHDNNWMKQMYEDRKRWSETFLQGILFAGFRTTSRCEGIHSYMDDYLDVKINLTEFILKIEMGIEKIRLLEASNDHDMLYSYPVLTGCLMSFQAQGNEIYTPKSFYLYKDELEEVADYIQVDEKEIEGDSITYKIHRIQSKAAPRIVFYDKAQGVIRCSCKLLESNGFPCRHIVKAVILEDEGILPASCFLKRWTKNAKDYSSFHCSESIPTLDLLQQVRFASLTGKCNRLCKFASLSDNVFEEACNEIERLTMQFIDQNPQLHAKEKLHNPYAGVRDPKKVRTKGTHGSTTKKDEKKFKKCGICRKPGHTRTTCKTIKREDELDSNEVDRSRHGTPDEQGSQQPPSNVHENIGSVIHARSHNLPSFTSQLAAMHYNLYVS